MTNWYSSNTVYLQHSRELLLFCILLTLIQQIFAETSTLIPRFIPARGAQSFAQKQMQSKWLYFACLGKKNHPVEDLYGVCVFAFYCFFPPWQSLIIRNISVTSSNPASNHDY